MPESMGGPAGDLYIIVRIGEHPVFKREGDDIHLDRPGDAQRGGFGRQGGSADHRWTRAAADSSRHAVGQKLRLREKGVPSAVTEGQRGDEIVEIQTVTPKVSDESRRRFCASWQS